MKREADGTGAALPRFYGAAGAPPEIRALYEELRRVWAADTCAPRMRADWTPENPTLGQCSVTAFLVQELFGGTVYGVPLGDGNYHCYNAALGAVFDLTSEQFGGRPPVYGDDPEQTREVHFAKAEKRARYELLKARLTALRAGR